MNISKYPLREILTPRTEEIASSCARINFHFFGPFTSQLAMKGVMYILRIEVCSKVFFPGFTFFQSLKAGI